jgi:hypothetical protein
MRSEPLLQNQVGRHICVLFWHPNCDNQLAVGSSVYWVNASQLHLDKMKSVETGIVAKIFKTDSNCVAILEQILVEKPGTLMSALNRLRDDGKLDKSLLPIEQL